MLILRLAKATFCIVSFCGMSACAGFGDLRDSEIVGNAEHSQSESKFIEFSRGVESEAYASASAGPTSSVQGKKLGMRDVLLELGVQRAQVMDVGVYGKIGNMAVFVADRKQVPNYDRLYWVMVRVLSEKYGCFITRKHVESDIVRFTCRDKRTVVMKRRISGEYSKFVARQYDAFGRDVVVTKRPNKKIASRGLVLK
jgi:hypothetical protein